MQQMRNRRVAFWAALMVAVMSLSATVEVSAQNSSVNAYSPYTMYGIGELGTHGNAINRMMGGVGVAWRSTQMVSMLNPAGYSAMRRKSFILDVSAEGYFLSNRQNKYDTTGAYLRQAKNAKNTVNLREIAVQMPLAKGLGLGISLAPYGSVGYSMSSVEESEDMWGNIGRVMYTYEGDGDVTEVKAGIGWQPFKGFSIGIAAKYYWGNIQHNYASSVSNDYVGSGDYVTAIGLHDYAISNFKFQVGLQWSIISNDKRLLTVGATYDYGGPLRPKVSRTVIINDLNSTVVEREDERGQMRLPHSVNAGVMYQDNKFTAGFDYQYQNWGGDNSLVESADGGLDVRYTNTHTYKVGFEYTPNRFDVRSYLRRVAYRVGFRYGNYYQTYGGKRLDQYAVTAGFGFPLRFLGSTSIDAGVEIGGLGTLASVVNASGQRIGLIRQNYVKVTLGISLFGEDYWFVRPKYD